ncbi:MAG: DivIVA domain-containing protein [Gaiellaceae bacterium]
MSADDIGGEMDARRRAMSATLPRDVPDEEIAGIRDVSFAIVMRGYDRAAVDAYVTRVNRIIAELQVSRSPQSAIRHALDQVSEETRGILERAHDTAEDITGRSRAQAAERVEQAEEEARAMIRDAEARVRELEGDADQVDRERARLIEDVRLVAEELQRVANDAAGRFPPEPEAEPEADTVAIDPDDLLPEPVAKSEARIEPEEPDAPHEPDPGEEPDAPDAPEERDEPDTAPPPEAPLPPGEAKPPPPHA